jgi:hypothetical protein
MDMGAELDLQCIYIIAYCICFENFLKTEKYISNIQNKGLQQA